MLLAILESIQQVTRAAFMQPSIVSRCFICGLIFSASSATLKRGSTPIILAPFLYSINGISRAILRSDSNSLKRLYSSKISRYSAQKIGPYYADWKIEYKSLH